MPIGPQFEAEGRRPAVRFRVPAETIRFDDLIRGEVEFDNGLLGDFVIVRADGSPLYHFVVVIDDEQMEISHVIRGEDHLSNTPKHIALIRALGYREPVFGHIPLILNPDRSKMSKRKSQTAISDYRAQGYLPEAMVNFLAFLGWSPGTEEELFTLDELAARFEITEVHKAGAVFDRDRLDYLNGVYIRGLTDAELASRLRPFVSPALSDDALAGLVPLVKERMVRLTDAAELSGFLAEPDDVVASLVDGRRPAAEGPGGRRGGRGHRPQRCDALAASDWTAEALEAAGRAAAEGLGWKAGDFFRPLRVAVTGKAVSPPLFGSMVLLGRDRTLARLDGALERLVAGALA